MRAEWFPKDQMKKLSFRLDIKARMPPMNLFFLSALVLKGSCVEEGSVWADELVLKE